MLNEASFNPKIKPPPDLDYWIKDEKPDVKPQEKKKNSSKEEEIIYDNKNPDVEIIN